MVDIRFRGGKVLSVLSNTLSFAKTFSSFEKECSAFPDYQFIEFIGGLVNKAEEAKIAAELFPDFNIPEFFYSRLMVFPCYRVEFYIHDKVIRQ